MIVMYYENSLTSIDSTFYHLKVSKDLPFHLVGRDMVLAFVGTVEDKLSLLYRLSNLGVFDFDGGSAYSPQDDLEDYLVSFINFFDGSTMVSLTKDCLDWLSVDLSSLFSECEKVKYTDTDRSDPFEEYLSSYPEFLLDTGEFLEEHATLVRVGAVGVLNLGHNYRDVSQLTEGLGRLLKRFYCLEKFAKVYEIMSSTTQTEDTYIRSLDNLLERGSWEYVGTKNIGASKLSSLLKYKSDRSIILAEFQKIYIDNQFFLGSPVPLRNLEYYKKIRIRLFKNNEYWDHSFNENLFSTAPIVHAKLPISGSDHWDRYYAKTYDPPYMIIEEDSEQCLIDLKVFLYFMM